MTANQDNIYVDMRPTDDGKFAPVSSLPYDLAGDIDFDWIKRQMSSEDDEGSSPYRIIAANILISSLKSRTICNSYLTQASMSYV